MARCNRWDWFFTITFDPALVDRYSYDDCSRKVSDWLSNLRKLDPYIQYLIVPEQHKDGAWHFHGLINHSPALCMTYSGKDTRRGVPIYNIGRYRFGYTTATHVQSSEAVSRYITKYITKELVSVSSGRKLYWASRNLKEPAEETCFLHPDDVKKLVADYMLVCTRSHVVELPFCLRLDTNKDELLYNATIRYITIPSECLQVPEDMRIGGFSA